MTGNSRKIFVPSVGSREEVTRNVRCVKATIERCLAGEPRFNILDAELERRHLLLQLGQIAREDLAPTALAGEAGLDPAQPLSDRMVLLLEAFEPAVDFIEVAEHLAPQLGDLPVDLVEPEVDLVESAGNEVEAAVDLLEAVVDLLEAVVDLLEAVVDLLDAVVDLLDAVIDLLEAVVDVGELPPEELDQLFVLGRGHGLMTTPGEGETQVYPSPDPSTRAPALAGASCSGFRPTGVLEGATGLPVGLHRPHAERTT